MALRTTLAAVILPATQAFTRRQGGKDMRLSTARDQFITDRRFGGQNKRRALAEKSLKRYTFALTGFIDWLTVTFKEPRRPADSVLMFNAEHARDYIAYRHGQDVKPNTLSIDCAALREFAKWGLSKRYWRDEDVEGMPSVIRPDSKPRAMSHEERDRVMTLPLYGDELVLRTLLFYGGAREDELLKLKKMHVRPQLMLSDGTVELGRLSLWGKGSREREVEVHPDLWAVLEPWLRNMKDLPPDTYILSRGDNQPWTPYMIISRVKRWGKAANVPDLKPHVMRHTFATNVYEQTGDIRVVQVLLGHKNLNTTQIYTRVVNKKRAAAIMSLPSFVHSSRSLNPDPPGETDG